MNALFSFSVFFCLLLRLVSIEYIGALVSQYRGGLVSIGVLSLVSTEVLHVS